jgi:hypothetical protein
VIVGPGGAAWITEGRQNAIGRVDPATRSVKLFPLLKERRNANLNTASFDRENNLWFTGQNGIYGRLDTKTGAMAVFDAPRGAGPYGIPPHRMAKCSSPLLPATISAKSTSKLVLLQCWNRLCLAKAHGASGATAAVPSGSPVGIPL